MRREKKGLGVGGEKVGLGPSFGSAAASVGRRVVGVVVGREGEAEGDCAAGPGLFLFQTPSPPRIIPFHGKERLLAWCNPPPRRGY